MTFLLLVIGHGLAGIVVGWLIVQGEAFRDRRMMRRLNAQPWWPPMGTKPPTIAELRRRRP